MREVDHFFLEQEEPNKSCFMALRDIILDFDTTFTETLKWGLPCYSYKNKMCCFLWQDKKTQEPYILFVEGNLLDHPRLEQGSRAKMKIFRVAADQDIPVDELHEVLADAVELYVCGKVKTK
ncbi:DUF1801 domain-containing protein [Flavobacteriaceae bacterium F08102]|nr:DUF1801 domain-containing protein [Flavobacteriaceae bacterium F08102]